MTRSKLVGTDVVIYLHVHDALIAVQLAEDTADRYAYFAVQIYGEVASRPELQASLKIMYASGKDAYPALKQWYRASGMAASDRVLSGYLESAGRGALRGAGEGVGEFFDIAVSIAKANHIEMNECALAITKVILDVLAGIGMASTVVGAWAAAFFVLAAANDANQMITACFRS